MTSPSHHVDVPSALVAVEAIREATQVMKTFAEETLPRLAVAERLTEGSRRWWAEWKEGRSA